jgi:mannose-1-phosphate guanylyltransferase
MMAQVRPLRPEYATMSLRHLWGIVVRAPHLHGHRSSVPVAARFKALRETSESLRGPLERATRIIAPGQLVTVFTREAFRAAPEEIAALPGHRCIQPSERGTAPEFFLATLGALRHDAHATVAALPAEHLREHGVRLMHYVGRAAGAVAVRADLPVVVGAYSEAADPEYGCVEPGDPVDGLDAFGVRAVRRFITSPSIAEQAAGYLSVLAVVMTARTVIALGRRHLPDVIECLEPLEDVIGDPEETLLCDAVWEAMPHASLSRDLLASVDQLGVIAIPDAMTGEWVRSSLHALAS